MSFSPDQVAAAVSKHGSINKAAAALGIARDTAQRKFKLSQIEAEEIPSGDVPIDELIERRVSDFRRRSVAHAANRMVNINVKDRAPIGLCFFGDPHVDDDGTDLGLLLEHADIVANTPGLYGMCVGDVTNNWVGRLARLYEHQGTTGAEAWRLAEEFIRRVDTWMAFVRGNHDAWSGSGDPLNWIVRGVGATVDAATDVRISLNFHSKKSCRIWMRHTFSGHSMWNTLHGLMRAAQMGNDFHIFAAGHTHTAAHHCEYSPEFKHMWHALRIGGYKTLDHYADEMGLRAQNRMPAAVAIINPNAKSDMDFIHVEYDVAAGADRLAWMRSKAA